MMNGGRQNRMQLFIIRVKGKIDESWSDCFEGFTLSHSGPDETILSGMVGDQAAFYGLIGKLRDLGLQLLEVNIVTKTDDSRDDMK